MIVLSVVTRSAEHGERDLLRYAPWETALRRFREDREELRPIRIQDLPDYVRAVPAAQREAALEDLAGEHLRESWAEGPGPLADAYLPVLGSLSDSLVEDEFLARWRLPHGDLPPVEDYARRFPDRPALLRVLRARRVGGGAYVKLGRIGAGAMNQVWEAVDRAGRRPVALKTPHVDLARDAGVLRCLSDEASLTAGLDHPGIVRIEAYHGEGEGAPFGVMRLARGRSLTDRIRDYHQPEVERTSGETRDLARGILGSFAEACDAVFFAHERGVLHRDLKPGNIMVGDEGRAAILDWGLARRVSESGGPVAGTPDYMPPEQADGVSDVRSDVFGLGAVLYESLTGRPPHGWTEEGRPADWPRLVREARFRPPRRLKPQVPAALEAVCMKALSREPSQRYCGADELARDVRRHLEGRPVQAPLEPASRRAWCWLRGIFG